jgi:hypothetical protein
MEALALGGDGNTAMKPISIVDASVTNEEKERK